MAHTNQTANYALSQFLGTDKPAWLVDYNGDMEKIDLGLKAAKDVADAAKEEADQGALDIAAVTITANSADAKATGAVSDLADAYDSTSTYNVGDFVIYSNILYRCISNITVPESFDGAHWARTTVEEIIAQINSDLSSKQNAYESIILNNVTTDANGSIKASSLDGKRIFDISCNLPAVICLSFDANGADKWLKFIDANTFNPISSVSIQTVVIRYFN